MTSVHVTPEGDVDRVEHDPPVAPLVDAEVDGEEFHYGRVETAVGLDTPGLPDLGDGTGDLLTDDAEAVVTTDVRHRDDDGDRGEVVLVAGPFPDDYDAEFADGVVWYAFAGDDTLEDVDATRVDPGEVGPGELHEHLAEAVETHALPGLVETLDERRDAGADGEGADNARDGVGDG